jgi:DNA-binding response OmpR family regulator
VGGGARERGAIHGKRGLMGANLEYLLIVEDDPDIRKLLDTALTFEGYRVLTASNGMEGLEIIQREHPAIVITDIMMPKVDGFGLVHRLRINPETRDIPVVFITATYVTLEDKEFALNIGATRFIQKPVDLEKFLTTIAELLQLGVPVEIESPKDFNFFDGYRKRLEIKLDQKNKQITRDELLLRTQLDENNQAIQESLHQAIIEREEIKLLIDQIHKQLEKYDEST